LIAKFPKNQRFVLGQRIENKILDMLEHIAIANREINKIPKLKIVSLELDQLRLLIKIAKDLRFISLRQYEIFSERSNEIGKMLYGWIKTSLNPKERKV
jgi:hypothetical protein